MINYIISTIYTLFYLFLVPLITVGEITVGRILELWPEIQVPGSGSGTYLTTLTIFAMNSCIVISVLLFALMLLYVYVSSSFFIMNLTKRVTSTLVPFLVFLLLASLALFLVLYLASALVDGGGSTRVPTSALLDEITHMTAPVAENIRECLCDTTGYHTSTLCAATGDDKFFAQ